MPKVVNNRIKVHAFCLPTPVFVYCLILLAQSNSIYYSLF